MKISLPYICLQNIDFEVPRALTLHEKGKITLMRLDPGEFRMIRGTDVVTVGMS